MDYELIPGDTFLLEGRLKRRRESYDVTYSETEGLFLPHLQKSAHFKTIYKQEFDETHLYLGGVIRGYIIGCGLVSQAEDIMEGLTRVLKSPTENLFHPTGYEGVITPEEWREHIDELRRVYDSILRDLPKTIDNVLEQISHEKADILSIESTTNN